MTLFRPVRSAFAACALSLLAIPVAAHAQYSESYEFLKAVDERDGAKATELLEKPGARVINARDIKTGETALHKVVARRDQAWLGFLLKKGADPNARDKNGVTPLILSASYRNTDAAEVLITVGADVNQANNAGETPLIRAVQLRDLAMVRLLLQNKANPDITDNVAGKSARDYASGDPRAVSILNEITDADTKRDNAKAEVFGPTLK